MIQKKSLSLNGNQGAFLASFGDPLKLRFRSDLSRHSCPCRLHSQLLHQPPRQAYRITLHLPSGSWPPISCIMSLNIFSLTPPPLRAGECSGKIVPILKPLGTAGAGALLSFGMGIPAIRKRKGESSVVGCDLRCSDISLYR